MNLILLGGVYVALEQKLPNSPAARRRRAVDLRGCCCRFLNSAGYSEYRGVGLEDARRYHETGYTHTHARAHTSGSNAACSLAYSRPNYLAPILPPS